MFQCGDEILISGSSNSGGKAVFFYGLAVQNVQVTLSNTLTPVSARTRLSGKLTEVFWRWLCFGYSEVFIDLGTFISSLCVCTIHVENKTDIFRSLWLILKCEGASLHSFLKGCMFPENSRQDRTHMTDITQYPDASFLQILRLKCIFFFFSSSVQDSLRKYVHCSRQEYLLILGDGICRITHNVSNPRLLMTNWTLLVAWLFYYYCYCAQISA